MNTLQIESLNKSFGSNIVLDRVSFSVPEHSIFGFLGQNGAGKTTTMRMILGLLKADGGSIKVCGEEVVFGETKTNRFVGYLPDVPEFYSYMNAREYLKLCGEITGLSSFQIKTKSDEMLSLVGLESVKKRISGYSRGMKQRLGIAQALLNEPKLLICDEPTSALDPVGRKEILDILYRVKDKTTVVFSTHILSDVERICDKIAILHKGKLVLNGTIDEMKERKKSEGILIEFSSKSDLQSFISQDKISKLCRNCEISNFMIKITSSNINLAEKDIIEVLGSTGILPTKLEIIEPTLENLFMEAIKQ